MRNIFRKIALKLSVWSLDKYQTVLIVVYGWDWIEGVREVTYNLLSDKASVRRNPKWIRWDLGLPLFLLGYGYQKNQSIISIALKLGVSFIKLLLPSGYKGNYIVVSLSATNPSTIQYWRPILEKAVVFNLPAKVENVNLEHELAAKDFVRYIDLTRIAENQDSAARQGVKVDNLDDKLDGFFYKKLGRLIAHINSSYIEEKKLGFSEEDLVNAVLKVDLREVLISRLKSNIRKEL